MTFHRLRPYRQSNQIRALFQDIHLLPADFIAPLFIHAEKESITISSMPFTKRYCFNDLINEVQTLLNLGIIAIALFPVIHESLKTPDCSIAYSDDGLVPSTIRELKKIFPHLIIIADIALDPYHPEGQDGLTYVDPMNHQTIIDNDSTLEILVKQACCFAKAGADILAPSDMMDGRIQYIKKALLDHKYIQTLVLSYSVKFASNLYGPFRDAVDSKRFLAKADKKTYQMDFKSSFQINLESITDINEGADILMVKPGLHYLDVIYQVHQMNQIPVWSYHVSGECSMLYAASQQGLVDFNATLLETLFAQKRAGAQKIFTYFAKEAAILLSNQFK